VEEKEVRIIKKLSLHLSLRLSTRDTFNKKGPLQLGSCDQRFPKKMYIYIISPLLKECKKWKEHIKNTKMAKFEAADIIE